MKESNIQKLIMIAVSDNGCMIMRNNCGVLKNPAGIPIKFGVGSPGGSDLIGITPVEITAEMVGKVLGFLPQSRSRQKPGRLDQIKSGSSKL